MSDWKEVYSEILSTYVGRYKEARGNSQLRNEVLAEVTTEILQHEPEDSVGLPPHLTLAIRREFLPHLDPEDQDDKIAIIQHILAVTRKSWAESCEGEDAREEKAHPTKAGDYKKAFTAFTVAQRIFKEEMDAYDRERRDTKDPKTIGQRNRIIQHWWESVSDERKAEAGRVVEKWNKTMGSHEVMFVAHEAGEGQIKIAVFETAPGDGKKAFTQPLESSKDWVLNGENSLTDYLLTAPVEEDSAEKHELEESLDEDGNPEMPTWSGQKLKVQQNLARAVFQAAYVWGIAKFTKKPKAKVPWGLLIKFPMEYLDLQSIPEGQFERRPVAGSSKKREWMDPEDDSEEVGDAGVHSGQMMKSGEVVNKGVEATIDVRDQAPEESSPAWHANKDHIQYLKSLSIMPRYQVLVDLVEDLPEEEHGKGREVALPHWATWTWSAKYFPQEIHWESACFWKALGELQSARFISSSLGGEVVLGLGLLLRECSCAQEVEEDDLLMVENVMDIVGLIVARLEQSSGMKEPQEGDEGAGMSGSDREDEEKEEEEAPPVVHTQIWKRAESGIVTSRKKVAKQDGKKDKEDGKNGKRGVRTQNQTRRAMGL
ncbi:hypothetical protein EDC04DRAFT_2604781 [Pisolithus marmoratus]|nr:hypothetical protein EDC04DRAFT_2604781 [Pisolithus marmoratus]